MRLVFQPLDDGQLTLSTQEEAGSTALAFDIGFHAFYTIRNDEISSAIEALRALARMAPPQAGMLRPSPALLSASKDGYATMLRSFVRRFGGDSRLVRLTLNALPVGSLDRWILRGVEKKNGAFVDINMVNSTVITVDSSPIADEITLTLLPYDPFVMYFVRPETDTPLGFASAISPALPLDPDAGPNLVSLAALAAVENPLLNTAQTVACVACHVSTVVMNARASSAGIDPTMLPGSYTSNYDLSVAGGQLPNTPHTLRALGYLHDLPMISQRVVNDTAQTLTEIEQRYPQ
jgi:hypothetical protein